MSRENPWLWGTAIVLIVSVTGLAYAAWTLYEENQEMKESLAALELDVEMGRASEGLLRARADTRLQGELTEVERRIREMEGFSFSSFSRDLGDLDSDLGRVESMLDDVESRLDDVEGIFWTPFSDLNLDGLNQEVAVLRTCADSLADVLLGFSTFIRC